eukprot:2242648-Pleurochrysis_carterae.AAC.2
MRQSVGLWETESLHRQLMDAENNWSICGKDSAALFWLRGSPRVPFPLTLRWQHHLKANRTRYRLRATHTHSVREGAVFQGDLHLTSKNARQSCAHGEAKLVKEARQIAQVDLQAEEASVAKPANGA